VDQTEGSAGNPWEITKKIGHVFFVRKWFWIFDFKKEKRGKTMMMINSLNFILLFLKLSVNGHVLLLFCSLHRLRHPSWALIRRSLKWSHLSHRFSHLPFYQLFVRKAVTSVSETEREGGGILYIKLSLNISKMQRSIIVVRSADSFRETNETLHTHSLLHLLYTWSFSPLLYI
jgi:hypothetical protein